jgi:acyl carrier protein
MNDTKLRVRAYILENFLMGAGRDTLRDEDSLIDRRVLDSTGFIELVTFIEQEFAIRVDDEEMTPENLDSLDNIAAYLQRKLDR